MPDPVFFLSRFRIKEGRLTAVRQMMSDATARIQVEKPRTLLFLAYMDADGGTISFLHAFADAESMDLHFVGSDERSRAAYEDIEPLGWEVTEVRVLRPWRHSDMRPSLLGYPLQYIPST